MSKIEQRLGNKEQMVSDQREVGRGITGGRRGRGKKRNMNRGLMGMDNDGIDCGSWGEWDWGGQWVKKQDNCN